MILSHNPSVPLQIIGLMSGTSLDGVDLAACEFKETEYGWQYKLLIAETINYSPEWENKLRNFHLSSAEELCLSHAALGRLYGEEIKNFIAKHKLKPDLIGSHGHTIFHQPSNGFTFQMGDGAQLAKICGIDTVCDFRNGDLAINGQGAPLVPVGDQLLFGNYEACLNLGGIANISMERNKKRVAFDICPVNMALNYLANKLGKPYDNEGEIAKSGTVISSLLEGLNTLDFYAVDGPKSLGREWFEQKFLPFLENQKESTADILRTVCEHIALQHQRIFKSQEIKNDVLVTGGGAFNTFLLDRIQAITRNHLRVPEKNVVNYKEAIIFGFLAMLFVCNRVNVLSNATGSIKDHVGGAFYRA